MLLLTNLHRYAILVILQLGPNANNACISHLIFMLNVQDRLEIILNTWIQLGYVPSPAEVSKVEGIDFLSSKGEAFSLASCSSNLLVVVFELL